MTTLEENEGNMEVLSITIHLYSKCRITSLGYAKIECSFGFGNEVWSSKKSVQSPYGWGWKSFTWSGLSVSKIELDNLQIKLRALIDATGFGGWVAVDAMYAEIEYRISYDTILRPDENVQIEWGDSSFENINDFVEIPNAGDGTTNSYAGHDESKADIFGMTTVDNIYKVISITVILFCSCEVDSQGYAEIRCRYRFGDGDWSNEQWVQSPFNMGWKSFSWGVSDARQADLNELQIRLTARIDATGFGGFVQVDVMYVKIQYSDHNSYPPSEELIGSGNRIFPNKPSSKLGFAVNTTSSDVQDAEILFSIKEELNDPYERYFRVYVDDQLKFEYYFDLSTGNNFTDTLIVNELKPEGCHQIVIEIFNGSYGSTPHYKLNYLSLSCLEFAEFIEDGEDIYSPTYIASEDENMDYGTVAINSRLKDLENIYGAIFDNEPWFSTSIVAAIDADIEDDTTNDYSDYYIHRFRVEFEILNPDGDYLDFSCYNIMEKQTSAEADPEPTSINSELVRLLSLVIHLFLDVIPGKIDWNYVFDYLIHLGGPDTLTDSTLIHEIQSDYFYIEWTVGTINYGGTNPLSFDYDGGIAPRQQLKELSLWSNWEPNLGDFGNYQLKIGWEVDVREYTKTLEGGGAPLAPTWWIHDISDDPIFILQGSQYINFEFMPSP